MTPAERLKQAEILVLSVMNDLDMSEIDCACPEHQHHYTNWSDVRTHQMLATVVQKIHRCITNDSITALSRWQQETREAEEYESKSMARRP